MAEEGTGTETWYPTEHAELVTTKGWTGPADVISSYAALEKGMGNRVKVPTDESTPEERSSFYAKCGRPETPEDYKLPELPEGKEYDMELVGGIRAIAHESGITDAQFSKLVEKYLGIEKQRAEATAAELVRSKEEGERALRETHGDKYDEFVEVSKRAYTEYGDDELFELMEDPQFKPLRNKLPFIRFMNKVGVGNLDDSFVPSEGQSGEDDKNFAPANPNSPGMYANDEGPDGKKNRDYFRRTMNYNYGHND